MKVINKAMRIMPLKIWPKKPHPLSQCEKMSGAKN
jgi:hypothetical protein